MTNSAAPGGALQPGVGDPASVADPAPPTKIDYETHPDRYRHYRVRYEGPVATLTLDADEDGGIRPGYKLKLNSYDLGWTSSCTMRLRAFASSIPRCAASC